MAALKIWYAPRYALLDSDHGSKVCAYQSRTSCPPSSNIRPAICQPGSQQITVFWAVQWATGWAHSNLLRIRSQVAGEALCAMSRRYLPLRHHGTTDLFLR